MNLDNGTVWVVSSQKSAKGKETIETIVYRVKTIATVQHRPSFTLAYATYLCFRAKVTQN